MDMEGVRTPNSERVAVNLPRNELAQNAMWSPQTETRSSLTHFMTWRYKFDEVVRCYTSRCQDQYETFIQEQLGVSKPLVIKRSNQSDVRHPSLHHGEDMQEGLASTQTELMRFDSPFLDTRDLSNIGNNSNAMTQWLDLSTDVSSFFFIIFHMAFIGKKGLENRIAGLRSRRGYAKSSAYQRICTMTANSKDSPEGLRSEQDSETCPLHVMHLCSSRITVACPGFPLATTQP